MKNLIPIFIIVGCVILTSCGNGDKADTSSTQSESIQETTDHSSDTTALAAEQADSTTAQGTSEALDLVDNQEVKPQTTQRTNNDDLENEKFRIAELERRRKLALLANPSLNIPDPQQTIAEEKAQFKQVVKSQADIKPAKMTTTESSKPKTQTVSNTSGKITLVESSPAPEPKSSPKPKPTISKPVVEAPPVAKAPVEVPTKPAQTNDKGVAKINFDQITFAFDTIVEGDVIDYQFKFVNTGTRTVEILNAKASCGCTRPSFPFLPIEPGQEGFIGVKYDSRTKSGNQTPEIEVVTNFQDDPIMLYLKGYVKDKPKADDENGK